MNVFIPLCVYVFLVDFFTVLFNHFDGLYSVSEHNQ